MWSHGIDFRARADRFDALMSGAGDWLDAVAEMRVRFVFWGAREADAYPDSAQPWRAKYRVVASGEWGEIYDLAEPVP